MHLSELKSKVVDKGLCIGCGFCTAANVGKGVRAVEMRYSSDHDHFVPSVSSGEVVGDPEVVCPGSKMDMVATAMQVYGRQPADAWLGEHRHVAAAFATSDEIRSVAASGGVTTALLKYLFDENAIDVAYAVVSDGSPYTRAGKVIREARELSMIHGSVYQPASFGDELQALLEGNERFAFVGLPCEIAAFELLKQKWPNLRQRHVLSVGLFCGGINRFAGINYYLQKFGVSLQNAKSIDYRYGAWPGKIRLVQDNKKSVEISRIRGNSRWNILRYVVGFQGYWMLPRCRICPDQISDFADIAVGDPHLPRFRAQKGLGFSAVVTRSERGDQWYKKALLSGVLEEQYLTREELIESQGYTLDNRRHSVAYVRVAKWLGMATPELTVYKEFMNSVRFSHYRYAFVDLWKIKFRKLVVLRPFYIPVQVFEYLFITLAPRVFFSRLKKLFSNS